MKKKNDNSSVEAYLKKRPDMNDKELEQKIKNMTDEDLVRVFLAMLKEDKNRAAYLFQYIKEVVNSSATMGSEGYQPIAMFTLYARESAGVTEFKFHRAMVLGRRFDERMLSLQRQGRIGTLLDKRCMLQK